MYDHYIALDWAQTNMAILGEAKELRPFASPRTTVIARGDNVRLERHF